MRRYWGRNRSGTSCSSTNTNMVIVNLKEPQKEVVRPRTQKQICKALHLPNTTEERKQIKEIRAQRNQEYHTGKHISFQL